MACHAMPWHDMQWHATACHAMPCHALPCHTIPWHTLTCQAMICHSRSIPFQPAALYHSMPHHAALHNVTLPANPLSPHSIPRFQRHPPPNPALPPPSLSQIKPATPLKKAIASPHPAPPRPRPSRARGHSQGAQAIWQQLFRFLHVCVR